MSLGILCPSEDGPIIRTIIKRNTAYPTQVTRIGKTHEDNQIGMKIPIYEGEHSNPKFSKFLGSMILKGINFGAKGAELVDITLSINRKGELKAKVTDRKTKATANIDIVRPRQFKENDIIKMKDEISKLEMPNETHSPTAVKKLKRVVLAYDENQYNANGYHRCSDSSASEDLILDT